MRQPALIASVSLLSVIPTIARAQLAVGNAPTSGAPVSPMFAIDVTGARPPRQLTAGNVSASGMTADNVGRVLYWTDTSNNLYSAPITLSGTLTPGAPVVLTVSSMQGLAWDSASNMLVGWSAPSFYQINPATGACTLLFSFTGLNPLFSGLDYDPGTDAFYAANDSTSTTPPLAGSGLYRISKPLTAPTVVRLSPYPSGETDVDGLAVANGKIYLVNDTPAQPIYVYDLSTNAYEPNLANPVIAGTLNSGGAWSPWLFDVPLTRSIPEAEPNQDKDFATGAINLGDGQGFRGTAASSADADWFLVGTPPGAPGIYRNEFRLYSTTPGHLATIRGLLQTPSGITFPSDTALQTALSDGDSRFTAVYSFGSRGQFYYRVAGATGTASEYVVRHTVVPVTPVDLGEFYSGPIQIIGDVTSTYDSDFWVYDGSFNPLSTFGHDDGDSTGATRSLEPGEYYIAMGSFNLANNQRSPADDTFRSGNVTEFPGVALRASSFLFSGQFRIADSAGPMLVDFTITMPFEIVWYKFTVVEQEFCIGDANRDGSVDGDDVIVFFENWDSGC